MLSFPKALKNDVKYIARIRPRAHEKYSWGKVGSILNICRFENMSISLKVTKLFITTNPPKKHEKMMFFSKI
eukprot:UN19553